jgi:GNAT superfamily N-acetyltransferase
VRRRPEYTLLAFDGDTLVAYAHCAPVVWTAQLDELPSQGWDQMVGRAVRATVGDRDSDVHIVCAFEVSVAVSRQGQGLSSVMLDAMRDTARKHGFDDLVAPVRPSAKHLEPRTPMEEYVRRVRSDGLPADAWLRVHVRAGGRIHGVCPASMSIAATRAEWRRWTGLAFDADGEVEVPGALVPVLVDVDRNVGVYTEPNVWVHHRLR